MATKTETAHVYVKFNNITTDYDAVDFKDLSNQVAAKLNVKPENQKFIHGGKNFTKKEIDTLADFPSNGIKDGVTIDLINLIDGGF
ncbi:hypothetical protein M9Y10_003917 [Tritrichomonas musculus]|uniref:Ubiquitin-like domain-containing protein n=1 Tax=Tritrichomonas musculus TaxID=1915356 RepID=A0ABR2JQL8_9EUKA